MRWKEAWSKIRIYIINFQRSIKIFAVDIKQIACTYKNENLSIYFIANKIFNRLI